MCEVCFDAVEDLAMPNRVIDSLRLPEEMDRRRKLTSAQKDDIKAKYVGGAWDDAGTRIHAEERQCAKQGGTLVDSSSGFICITHKGVLK